MNTTASSSSRAVGAVSAWASTVDWIAAGKKGAFAFLALELWAVQYAFWVPLVLAGRLLTQTLRAFRVVARGTAWFVFGVFLLFVPIFGWIVLLFVAQMRSNERTAERHHAELMAALTGTDPRKAHGPAQDRPSVFRPWLLDWIKDNTRGPVTSESDGPTAMGTRPHGE